jgi:peptide/nickel transport system permease protein
MNLNNWYLKRIGQATFTVYAVITLSFVLIRALPGGPEAYLRAQLALGGSTDYEEAGRLIEQYIKINPSKPLWEQYLDYMVAILQGDLGRSIYYDEPVAGFLAEVLPWTIFYASISLVLTYVLAIAFGAFMAYYEGTTFDTSGSIGSIVSNSIPYYAVALVLLFLLGYQLGIFPTGGKYNPDVTVGPSLEFVASASYHAALPILSFVVTAVGGIALAMRGNAISVLGEDYLRVADLRGLPAQRIALRYVARNAVLPLYTQLMISMGYIFGGSIVLETIFRYPAAGYYMLQAIDARDSPLMMGVFIAITVSVVIGVFVADLTYGYLDPRASAGGDSGEVY